MHTVRRIAFLLIVCLAGASFHPDRPAVAAGRKDVADRPNILLLVVDDLRPDALGAFDNPVVKTPHLDSLVHGGFAFHNAYCLGSNSPAVCSPSRNMLLSGQSYFRNWPGGLAPGDGPNLPDAMKAVGYETYHHGKHGNVARAIHQRFDHTKYLADDEQERRSGEPGHTIADAAIDFLQTRRLTSPWLMLLEFESPHDPRVADRRFLDLYHREQIPLPRNYMPLHPFDNGEMLVRDERLAPWPRSEEEIRRQLHEYYAVMSGLDFHIGRLLAKLDELQLRKNTLIIFASDHGLAIGSHGLMGKQNLYEHSMRTPLVFNGLGIKPGSSEALVYLLDVLPTLCELVQASPPPEIDGQSLAGILSGRQTKVRDTLFTAYRDAQRAVRDERWKLIRYPLVDRTQLFDLREDPDELVNLANDPAQSGRMALLTQHMQQWQKRLGDKSPLVVTEPRPAEFRLPRE
ncbi:MAG TPA: sulfatase-like hydrolase/transferase [Pirellulales bacterium]|jgi:arylsulfatase A-like enzyme